MTDPSSAHEHLDEDAVEEAARRYVDSAELPECATCASEVTELARYLSTSELLSRRQSEPTGTPAADAVRRVRRDTYPRRVTELLSAMVFRRSDETS